MRQLPRSRLRAQPLRSQGLLNVSVVIATRDRPERLSRLLRALEGVDAEVVVVDDGSQPPAVGSTLRFEQSRGPAAARNAGWRRASGDLIAFTDDDCEPQEGWVDALAAVARRSPGAIVQGLTAPHPEERARHPGAFVRTLSVQAITPFHPTCNILYPRTLLERLGGFDESFPFPAGEDTDLGWRAVKAGADVVFAPEAVVWHAVHDLGPIDMVRAAAKWHTTVRVVARHPQLRAHLHHRLFWKPSHERLLAVALAPRRVKPLVLAWYAAGYRSSHGSWAGTLAKLPAHIAIDAAEVVAMLRGSISARTVVL